VSEHVGIVGSRDWPDLEVVRLYVIDGLEDGATVVSGGARGVDATAEAAAEERGLRWYSFRPRKVGARYRIMLASNDGLGARECQHRRAYPSFGSAAFARNRLIVQHSQRIVAFNAGTKGTANTVEIAEELGIPVETIKPEEMSWA
jgi:predicted Rossmann fold nucleotide-binding protein DprA/Smf involved in DNA uptake